MIKEKIVKSWGLPEFFNNSKLEYVFNLDEEELDFLENKYNNEKLFKYLGCGNGYCKFCLYNRDVREVAFVFEFSIKNMPDMSNQNRMSTRMKIECLCVPEVSMRERGLSKYYLDKLIKFGLDNNIKKYLLSPNPNDDIFNGLDKTGALGKKSLVYFYINAFEKHGFISEEEVNEDVNHGEGVYTFYKL